MKNSKKISTFSIIFFVIFTSNTLAVTIVIDPGHGGSDPGAIGINGLYEKEVNLDVSMKLKKELNDRGYHVLLTRNDDRSMNLDDRVSFKEAHEADLFVSIHANAFHNSSASGSLVLYFDRKYAKSEYPASPSMAALTNVNKVFAQTVLDHLLEHAGTQNQGLMPSSVRVVRLGTMPSILVETAFLSNPEDAAKLASSEVRSNMAKGIASGIEQFYPLEGFRDIAGHWAYEAIQRLSELGIVQGADHLYSPERPLTRAEFLTIMDRVFEFTAPGAVSILSAEPTVTSSVYSEITFTDLEPSFWAYSTLEIASSLGYIQGYPDGTIRPNQAITRAEVSVLFDRIWENVKVKPPLGIHLFDDVPKGTWFAPSVYRLKRASIIEGVSQTLFKPIRSMSRAEIAVMIDRYLGQQLLL